MNWGPSWAASQRRIQPAPVSGGFVDCGAGGRRRNRVVNFGLAVVLALLSAVAGAPQARANSAPWVPPSGGEVAALEAAVSGVSQDIGSVQIGPMPTGNSNYRGFFPCGLVQAADGRPAVKLCSRYGSQDQTPTNWNNSGLAWTTNQEIRCENGSAATGITVTGTLSNGGFPINLNGACSGGTVIFAREARIDNGWDFGLTYEVRVHPPGSVEATCSDGSTIVTRQASGYGNLSVTCPAGMVVVGATTNGSSYQIPGYATTPGLAVACAGGGCDPRIEYGGYSCDPTMAISLADPEWCRRAKDGGTIPSEAECKWLSVRAPGVPGSIPLPVGDCKSYLEGLTGPGPGQPEDSDTGIISEWLQRIKIAIDLARDVIQGAVDGVKDVVEAGLGGLGDKLDDLIDAVGGEGPGEGAGMSVCGRQPVSNWLNPAEWVYDAIECALVPSEGFMEGLAVEWQAGLTGALGEWAPGPGGIWDDMTTTVDSVGRVCSCGYWEVEMFGAEFRILDTCTDDNLKMLRDLSHSLSGAVVVVAGLLSCGGLITSALGLPFFRGERGPINLTGSTRGDEWRKDRE